MNGAPQQPPESPSTLHLQKIGSFSVQDTSHGKLGLKFCPGTARSLLAFDVDKTVLHQGDPQELELFRTGIGRTLLELAGLGFKLAAVTGNSLAQLSSRYLKVLLELLCAEAKLSLLVNFHHFCNGAAVYIHIDPTRDRGLEGLLRRAGALSPEELLAEASVVVFDEKGLVRSSFIVTRYAQKCCIPAEDASEITDICKATVEEWWQEACEGGDAPSAAARSRFYIATGDPDHDAALQREAKADRVNAEAAVFGPRHAPPTVSARTCMGLDGRSYVTSLNVMPVLSFRHARLKVLVPHQDPRIAMIRRIREHMGRAGLLRYIVSPGGRQTIDICHHMVNKGSAVQWLLGHLGVEGVAQLGEPLGVNCVYFGDEVVANGNDLPVSEIPGVLVFAVNELVQRVPFANNIELPSEFTTQRGPDATQAVMEDILKYCREQLAARDAPWAGESAIAAWKVQRLQQRLELKRGRLMERAGPVTYRRLEAATAVLTALTRRGEGLDQLADQVIAMVNHLGLVSAHVNEAMFESVAAQGIHRVTRDHREDAILAEAGDGAPGGLPPVHGHGDVRYASPLGSTWSREAL